MFRKILNIGSDIPDDRYRERIKVINLTAMLAIFLSIPNRALFSFIIPDSISNETWVGGAVQTVFILSYTLCFVFNSRHKFRLSAIWLTFNAIAQLSVMPIVFLGSGIGVHFYLITITPLGLLYLNRGPELWIILLAGFLSLGLFVYCQFYLTDPMYGTAVYLGFTKYVHQANFLMAIIMICVITFIFARDLNQAKDQANDLLLNIIPKPIAERLKAEPGNIADGFDEATILFADIVNFTKLSESMTPSELVSILDAMFSEFDSLVDQFGLEKIKTIGDAYMVAGGVPEPHAEHIEKTVALAKAMQVVVEEKFAADYDLALRIGIHSGPIVAGIIGKKKFVYDLWGDSVNLASRLESHGLAGRIQVSDVVYSRLKGQFDFEYRGKVDIKGKGETDTYFLL